MTKDKAEQGIRHLCGVWAKSIGVRPDPAEQPSFSDFFSWVQESHHEYLDFRTTTSVSMDVENWFDQETKQTWRN